MGDPTAFKRTPRREPHKRPVALRVLDWQEIYEELPQEALQEQGARCMDCGVPFCHSACPLGNLIPDWNDRVYRGQHREALELLLATNDFPEFTGRVCPAPCEAACVLARDAPTTVRPERSEAQSKGAASSAVTIEHIERHIVERGFAEGWITPRPPLRRSGKRVAVVGSGPAGLAAAAQLNRAGHLVTVFEREDRAGGLLVYGIPPFKLEKHIVTRRLRLLEAEGVRFELGVEVEAAALRRGFDAICLAIGAGAARELPVPGRELRGVHLAMEYLTQQNRRDLGDDIPAEQAISAAGKQVVILGGGDTGADCLGTALRQGASRVVQLELLPRPPGERAADNPWPAWPLILRQSPAHDEGGERDFSVMTTALSGEDGQLRRLHAARLRWEGQGADRRMAPIPGSDMIIPCDLLLLALGFTGPEAGKRGALVEALGLSRDARGNLATDERCRSQVPGVFVAGDARRGQSLVVWAIAEGRRAAREIDAFLTGGPI